jgi:hypothetical protein
MRVRFVAILAVVTAILGGAPAHAAGSFKGTFGDIRFKAKKRVVGCNYNRSLGLFLVSGSSAKQHGRLQRGASASGTSPDPSAPGTVFPIVLAEPTMSFFDGPSLSPTLWTGSAALGNDVVLTITGYKRGKISGTLTATSVPAALGSGAPIAVDATFSAKCTIL